MAEVMATNFYTSLQKVLPVKNVKYDFRLLDSLSLPSFFVKSEGRSIREEPYQYVWGACEFVLTLIYFVLNHDN